ncbi:receptor-transporting protein 3 [Octodon degus]|uniref:Receptor-transporting protein 3 n=1 Tax=Octodon degus TaxID=10160 RepID=A0A6P6D8J6_OCTDE|nr:receptor-transporting protein 3 [Octodon degus]
MTAMDQDAEEWEQVFQELIREVKPWHSWTLVTDKELLPNVLQQGWAQFQQKTFARFCCSSCLRSWSSAKVQVLFHVHWSKKKRRGQVKMRVFAQRCKKCTESHFEVPELTPENIRRTLTNLVFSILRKCYKEGFKPMEELPPVKDTSLEGPHDSLNCEACLQGFCAQSGGNLVPQSSGPTLLSTPSKDTRMPGVITIYSRRHCSPPPKMEKLLVSKMTPKDLNLPKAESKPSHTSKSSAALTYPNKEVSPTLTVTPKVPHPVKVDPKASHTSKPLGTLRTPTEEEPPTLTVTPKVPSCPSMEDNMLTWLGAQVPSPTRSRTETGTTDTRVTIHEVQPASPWPSRSTWERGGSSWNQGREVDSGAPMILTWSEPPTSRCTPQGCEDPRCCSQGCEDPRCCSQGCEDPRCWMRGPALLLPGMRGPALLLPGMRGPALLLLLHPSIPGGLVVPLMFARSLAARCSLLSENN